MMKSSTLLRALAVSLLIFQLFLDAGLFLGINVARNLSIILLPMTNFSVYFGLSLLLYPIYGQRYSNFWQMALRRGCIPVLLSSLLYLPLILVLFSITTLFFQRLNEPQLISLTLFTAFLLHVLAVVRAVLEVRVETPDFQPNPVNVLVLISLLLSSVLLTQPLYTFSSGLFSGVPRGLRDLAFVVRLSFPSISAAMLSVPYLALLHPPKPSERKLR